MGTRRIHSWRGPVFALVVGWVLGSVGAGPASADHSAKPAAIQLRPVCGPEIVDREAAYTIYVSGENFAPSSEDQPVEVEILFALGSEAATGLRLTTSTEGAFTAPIEPESLPPGEYEVVATDELGHEARDVFSVPCQSPTAPAETDSPPKLRFGADRQVSSANEDDDENTGEDIAWSVGGLVVGLALGAGGARLRRRGV